MIPDLQQEDARLRGLIDGLPSERLAQLSGLYATVQNLAVDIAKLERQYDIYYADDPNSDDAIVDYVYALLLVAKAPYFNGPETLYPINDLTSKPTEAAFQTYIDANQTDLATAQADFQTALGQINAQTTEFSTLKGFNYEAAVVDHHFYINDSALPVDDSLN